MIGNEDRTADRVAPVVLLVFRDRIRVVVEEVLSVEGVIAAEIVGISVEMSCSGLRFHFHRA